MGTHPIFESDFDCLTDFATWDTKTSGSRTRAKTPKEKDSANAGSLAADRDSSANTDSTCPAEHSEKSPQWSDSRSSIKPPTRTKTPLLLCSAVTHSFNEYI